MEIVRSTKESQVIPKLDKIFDTHEIPTVVKSDNSPPFNSEESRKYLEVLGIKPAFSTPYWRKGIAEAEQIMQPLGKALKTAKIQSRPWQQELSRFLHQYQTAPHVTTGVPPSELLFNRTVKEKLAVLQKRNIINKNKRARANEIIKQQYNKQYADNKLTSRFNATRYTVTERNKSQVAVTRRNGHTTY